MAPEERTFRYSPFPIFLKIMNQTTSILNQKLTISENTLSQELHGEIVILNKVDNRLPYEKPWLRKYGKVNGETNSLVFAPDFDGFGLNYTDFS